MDKLRSVWTIKKTSSWGSDDPDIWRPYFLPKELVGYLDANDDIKDRADFAADRIKDELETALVHYQTIMSNRFASQSLSQQRAAYESLYSDLWTLYKDRMQQYLKEVGVDIGFMFAQDGKNFIKYAKLFVIEHPDNASFVEYAKQQRELWQNDFAKYRNAHEHLGDLRNDVIEFDNPMDAKRLFAQTCYTLETTIAHLVSYKLKPEWNLIDNHPKSTIFDRLERFTIEHSYITQQRENSSEK